MSWILTPCPEIPLLFFIREIMSWHLSKSRIRCDPIRTRRGVKYYDSFVIITILLWILRHCDRQRKITIFVFFGNKPSLLVEKQCIKAWRKGCCAFANCADFLFLHQTNTNIVFQAKLCHFNKFSHIETRQSIIYRISLKSSVWRISVTNACNIESSSDFVDRFTTNQWHRIYL